MRMELYNKFMKLLHIGQYLNNFQKDIIYQNRKDRLTELALCSSTKGISKERYCQKEVIQLMEKDFMMFIWLLSLLCNKV